MKNIFRNKIVILGLALTAAFGVVVLKTKAMAPSTAAVKAVYYCPMHPTYTSDRPGHCPICHMELVLMKADGPMASETIPEKAAAVMPREFTMDEIMKMKPGELCLMHKCRMGNCLIAMTPELARIGKCPHCGDDLGIVIKDLLPQGYGTVRVDPEKIRMIGVKTEAAQKRLIQKTIRAAGTVAHDAELYQAEAEFIQALAAVKQGAASSSAQDMVEASRIRLRHLGLNENLIEEVSRQSAPDHGLLYAHGGGPVWVYANVYEYEMALVKPGQSAAVESASYPGKTLTGHVRAVDPMVDMKTRTTRVRILVDNPEELLKPDMFVNASIQVDLGNVLAVPRGAVLDTGARKILFVEKPAGQFEPREVVLGAAADDYFAVEQGLQEGEFVVTSGNFLIDSESRLKAALQTAVNGGHVHGA